MNIQYQPKSMNANRVALVGMCMNVCTFCNNPAIVHCTWIKADRTPCPSIMCLDCKTHPLGICHHHPHGSWVEHTMDKIKIPVHIKPVDEASEVAMQTQRTRQEQGSPS